MGNSSNSHPPVSSNILHRQTDYQPRRTLSSWLIGKPLPTADAPHQTIGKAVGLAVFASDALSSTAYATQEILLILAVAGATAFGYAFPISIAIVALLAIVAFSYEQTIHAYPDGGGAYIVARDNLGEVFAQIAAAALLVDYILTVSVSISSGVAQLVSAYPVLHPSRVAIAVVLVFFVMVINLRGVRESGFAFAIPSYFFVAAMFITIGVGFFKQIFGAGLGVVVDPPHMDMHGEMQAISLFLILHAFSSGTAALTGIEAISNGVTAFKEPRSRNAGITLIVMACFLSVLFLGITYLSTQIGAVPSESETVISQLARTVFGGRNIFYLAVIAGTTLILVLAANTAFAGFPRLSALTAKDGFLPRQLTFRGSRLVYSRGIISLAILASLLIILFNASVSGLIPLYAIGVFLSFTLSQAGMAHRWWKSSKLSEGESLQEAGSILQYDRLWRPKMVFNAFGSICTFVVMMVFAITKFTTGAWIVLIVLPVLVFIFYSIHRHYKNLASHLTLEDFGSPRTIQRHRVFLTVSSVHRGTIHALNYARSLSDDVTGVHVMIDPEDAEKVSRKWEDWGMGTRLVILDSPYRLLIEPLLAYLENVLSLRQPGEVITVVVPQFVPSNALSNALHAQTAFWLRNALLGHSGIVIVEVPYKIEA